MFGLKHVKYTTLYTGVD